MKTECSLHEAFKFVPDRTKSKTVLLYVLYVLYAHVCCISCCMGVNNNNWLVKKILKLTAFLPAVNVYVKTKHLQVQVHHINCY